MRHGLQPADEFAVAAAQNAAQSGIRELLRLHEAKVLARMIRDFRSKDGISPENAKIGVAVISELRILAGDVDRAVERGTDAGRRITGE